MNRIQLGTSDLSISRIIFGSMGHGALSREEQVRVIHAALDAGTTSIDTAPLYDFGEVERTVGEAIRDRRHDVELLSKVGLRWDDDHGDVLFEFDDASGARKKVRRDSRPTAIRNDVEESLQRLGTDYIDLCQIHHPDARVPIAESLGELERLVSEGKIRAIGVSNFTPEQILRAVAALGDSPGGVRLASDQLKYNLLAREPEREIVPLALKHGFGLLAYSPLDAGSLAGPIGGAPRQRNRASFHPANRSQIDSALRDCVEPIAAQRDTNLATVCLAWLLAQPGLSGVVVGASHPAQAIANTQASDFMLGAEEVSSIGVRFSQVKIDETLGLGSGAKLRKFAFRARRKLGRLLGSR